MELSEFLLLSSEKIREIVESKKGKNSTLVYAYDGTRRSYLIEEGIKSMSVPSNKIVKIDYNQYSKSAFKKLLHHLVMMFQHGIKTIVYPMWFCTLEKRGPEYLPKFIQYLWGVVELLSDEKLFKLYESEGIRVIFYGEYQELLFRGNDSILLDKFHEIMDRTKNNSKKVVLFGTNIDEPSNTLIKNTLSFYNKFHRIPSKNELINQYYGVDVEDISIYIGFDRFSTDGRPILISDKGNEDLYYTVSPHSFLEEKQFRSILFDHLYQRSVTNAKEYELKLKDIESMKEFYEINSQSVMGVGSISSSDAKFWHPMPQVIVNNKPNLTIKVPIKKNSGNGSFIDALSSTDSSTVPVISKNNSNDPSKQLSRKLSSSSCNSGSCGSSAPSSPTIDSTPSSSSNSFLSNISSLPLLSTFSLNSSGYSSSGSQSPLSPPLSPLSPLSPSSPSLVSKHLSPTLYQRIQPFLQPS